MANGYFSSSTGCVFLRNDNIAGGVAQLRLITLSGRSQIFSVPAGTQLILRDVLRLEELDVGGIALSSLTVLDVPAGTDCAPATINTTSLPISKKCKFHSAFTMSASTWKSVALFDDITGAPVIDSISICDPVSKACASINQITIARIAYTWYLVFYAVTSATNANLTIIYTVYPASE